MNGKYEKPLRYAMFAGLIIATLAIFFMAPWSERMGVSGSPQRTLLVWIFAVVGALPFAIYFMYKFSLHPEWNAMPGRFVEGMKVKTFSPYTYVAIGVVGALFAVAGMTEGIRLDFQAMVISASASLFGGIISFFGLLVGQIIARLLINPFWVSGNPAGFLSVLPYAIFDASIWAFFGYTYFRFVHSRPAGKAFLPALLTAWVIAEPVHQIGWLVGDYIIGNPWSAAALNIARDWIAPQPGFPFLPYWVLSAFAFVPIGLLAGEAARRAWKGGR